MAGDVEPTQGELTDLDATEAGTAAASPRAIAEVAAAGSNAQSGGEARPTNWATASHRPTAAQALDRSDLERSRVFHVFGIGAPLAAIGLTVFLGGDPVARVAFWIGAALLSACNVGLLWFTSKPERYSARGVGALWITATVVIQPALYYFGPFSAVVIVDIIGIVFIAIGRLKRSAIATAAICIVAHVGLAVPVMLGWVRDPGILTSAGRSTTQLAIAEALIVIFLVAGFALGRWARTTAATALAELKSAMRIIGDQQQALAEVVDEAQRQKRVNEGRWTGQQLGSFKLGLVLGRGAMGEVYEAHTPDGAPVAIKLLNARATTSSAIVERFYREMDVAARLESPNIVKVLEVSPPGAPLPYIAMERLHGTDLATRLRAENRLPSDELIVMVDQVARGLEIAQRAGVVHRDLKPHNLFQHDGGVWKILDFGVSKVMDSEGTLTGDGIVGTPQYMAPEQASGGDVTHLADVYALGAIAYRCLTGRSPFKGKDLAELVYQVVHVAPVRPSMFSRVSLAIEDVLAVAMAKDPRRRFATARAFAQALVDARRGKPLAQQPPPNAWT